MIKNSVIPNSWLTEACTDEYLRNIERYPTRHAEFTEELAELVKKDVELSELHILFKRMIGKYQVKCLREFIGRKKSVSFFCPTASFRNHYYGVPRSLEDMGVAFVYLYGTVCNDSFENHEGSFFWGAPDQYLSTNELGFIDLFIIATIMDCLPENSTTVLLDHISFATFSPDPSEENGLIPDNPTLDEQQELLKSHEMMSMLPMIDYYLIPSAVRMEELSSKFAAYNYRNPRARAATSSDQDRCLAKLFTEIQYGGRDAMKRKVTLIPSGYCKFDALLKAKKEREPSQEKRIIVYAPTPNDPGNKQHWSSHLSINISGVDIVSELCRKFPDYSIVFKPYIDERADIVEEIVRKNKHYENFEFATGYDYIELYSDASLMLSDFSSTAYTFAFLTLKPVVFFSCNEDILSSNTSSYLTYRTEVGAVISSVSDIEGNVRALLERNAEYAASITELRDRKLYNFGSSEQYVASTLYKILQEEALGEERVEFFLEDEKPTFLKMISCVLHRLGA